MKKLALFFLVFSMAGCNYNTFIGEEFSAQIILTDGTTIHCQNGILISAELCLNKGTSICYKKTSEEAVRNVFIEKIAIERKTKDRAD